MKYIEFVNEVESLYVTHSQRLYSCSAKVCRLALSTILHDTPIALVSYNTCVAVYLPHNSRLYVFDYYSPTTCQHVCKFERWLKERHHDVKRINLYHRKRNKNGSYLVYDDEVEV